MDELYILINSSGNVKKLSNVINYKSKDIFHEINEVSKLSNENLDDINRFKKSVDELSETADVLSTLGEKNYENINILDNQLKKFKTKEGNENNNES